MANFDFNSTHRIPDGMTKPAGRIADGAFLGRFSNPNMGADQFTLGEKGYGTIDVYARVYKGFNKIIANVKQYGPATGGANGTPLTVKSKEFLMNYIGGLANEFKTLVYVANESASQAELATLGLTEGQVFPLVSTNLPINWQVDDNGYLKIYTEATDPNDTLKKLADQNSKLFDQIAASVTGNKDTPDAPAATALSKYLRWGAIALGIAATIAVVIVIFKAVSK